MSDDLLERMTKALREEGGKEPSPERSSLVRARVMAQTKRGASFRPQNMWQWAAVVCLGFFVSTAMAHVIKVQLPKVIEAFREEPPAPPPPKAAAKRVKPVQPVQPKAAEPEAPEPAAPAPTPEPTEPEPPVANAAPSEPPQKTAPARTPRPAKTAPRPAPKPPAPAPAPAPTETALAAVIPDDEPPPMPTVAPPEATPVKAAPKLPAAESAELALFRRAQSLHLAHDAKAIEAWDAYLRVAGTSALAPEARYNRALGLVRAKRFAEAKQALAPFANGKYGAYRREEAQALLDRLPK